MDTTVNEYEQAKNLIKTTGILSIVFGALGIIFAAIAMFLMFFDKYDTPADAFYGVIISTSFIFLFWLVPHLFLVVSGIKLLHTPRLPIIRGLIITTLVVSAFWNLVLLVFTIINLTQLKQYEEGLKSALPKRKTSSF